LQSVAKTTSQEDINKKEINIMKSIRRILKQISLFLAILMITVLTPYQTALAKMISTETIIDAGRAQEARVYVNSALAREDVMAVLISHGIDMSEAKARVDSLTDSEIVSIADKIEQLPVGAGGFVVGMVIISAIWVFFFVIIPPLLPSNKRKLAKELKFEQRFVNAGICPKCGNDLVVNPKWGIYHCTECGFKER
jgi:hypothetical protein